VTHSLETDLFVVGVVVGGSFTRVVGVGAGGSAVAEALPSTQQLLQTKGISSGRVFMMNTI
jgi:hypothetical protein